MAASLRLMQKGIDGARWTAQPDFHLTLRFVGAADEDILARIGRGLAQVRASSFDFTLAGAGSFPPSDWMQAAWMGVDAPPALVDLKKQIDDVLVTCGIAREPRPFTPHVTMAYLRAGDAQDVARFIQTHKSYRSTTVRADRFTLYESLPDRADNAQKYLPLADYSLLTT